MQRIARTWSHAVAATAILSTLAFTAHAQPAQHPHQTPAPQACPYQGAHGMPDFAQAHAQLTERLKTLLQLQPSQQAAWDKYVKAITPEPPTGTAAEHPDMRKLTTPERLDLMQKLRKEHMAKAEQREQATRSFYNSLNPSQQKAFDELTAHHHGMHAGHPGARQRMDHGGAHHGHGPAGHPPAASTPAT